MKKALILFVLLVGCATNKGAVNTRPELLESPVVLDTPVSNHLSSTKEATEKDRLTPTTLLVAPKLDLLSQSKPVFHPLFTRKNYETLLNLCDLSYAVVVDFDHKKGLTTEKNARLPQIRERILEQTTSLTKGGWSQPVPIFGKTGRNNDQEDLSAIMTTHSQNRLIIVAFHGSRNGSKIPFYHNGQGDWGANFDSVPVAPSSVGLPELPDRIRVHRGIGRNFASTKPLLFRMIDQKLKEWGDEKDIWIWTTGHSKGGAMAALGATLIKTHLKAKATSRDHVHVASVAFSSPRVFFGEEGKTWVYRLMDQRNLFRINVHGDPAVLAPSPIVKGYRSLGVLFLDSISNVKVRMNQNYGVSTRSWRIMGIHYTSNERGEGFSFDPKIVMSYNDLVRGFEEGRLHLRSKYIKD